MVEVERADKIYSAQALLLFDCMTLVFTTTTTTTTTKLTVPLAALTDLEPGSLVEVRKADKIITQCTAITTAGLYNNCIHYTAT